MTEQVDFNMQKVIDAVLKEFTKARDTENELIHHDSRTFGHFWNRYNPLYYIVLIVFIIFVTCTVDIYDTHAFLNAFAPGFICINLFLGVHFVIWRYNVVYRVRHWSDDYLRRLSTQEETDQ